MHHLLPTAHWCACALQISDATIIDKIRGLFLYMWRAINKCVPRAFSDRRNISTYAGDLLAGAMNFNKRFTAAWAADGYRDYLSPETASAESGKTVLSRLLRKGTAESFLTASAGPGPSSPTAASDGYGDTAYTRSGGGGGGGYSSSGLSEGIPPPPPPPQSGYASMPYDRITPGPSAPPPMPSSGYPAGYGVSSGASRSVGSPRAPPPAATASGPSPYDFLSYGSTSYGGTTGTGAAAVDYGY